MANANTQLYASQENGFKSTVSLQEIADFVGSSGSVPAATTTTAGIVKQSVAQADSVAADVPTLVADFNALLAKLRVAGILAP